MAAITRPNGNRSIAPPATKRRTTKSGNARVNKTTAIIFATPQVILNANLIA